MNQQGNAPETQTRILENAQLRVIIAPQRGGKIISLYSKHSGTEWLLPPLRPYDQAKTTGGFEQWDGGGFDECLPTVAATSTAPDHGEVWRKAWTEDEGAGDGLSLRVTACDGEIEFQRRASLEGDALVLDYTLTNVGKATRALLYSAHPLLRVEEGDRIVLPPETEYVTVEGSLGERLGRQGDRIRWPHPDIPGTAGAGKEDLSRVGPPDGLAADKLFVGPCTSGWCQLQRPVLGEALELTFDPLVLPYLGLWICRAAWPETGQNKQYTVALEPTHANCDSLADAERNGTAWRLASGEQRAWSLRLRAAAIAKEETR